MARRKKDKHPPDKHMVLKFLELQCAVIQHCQALKAVTQMLLDDQKAAAVARLDGAVTALQATVRGQCIGQTMNCPACGSEQDVVAWVDDRKCHVCGEELEIPEGK